MIFDQVEATIKRFGMLKPDDRIIAAVSGGPDSVFLVYLLNRLKKKWRLYLHLAHLNHMLRGKESDRDALFVAELARRLRLPFSCEKTDVQTYARQVRLSVEEAARKKRYEFLLRVAQTNNAGKIALGHNQDDQAETVLMRFLRGSGLSGLRGMPAARRLESCRIIRPLIEIRRFQIEKFLAAKNIAFCIDSSNRKDLYLRNRIRNKLLPFLENDFNPNIKIMLTDFARNLSEDFDYLDKMGQNTYKTVRAKSSNGKIVLNLKKFSALHQALQKLVSRQAIKELNGDTRKMDYRHWKELEDLVRNRPAGSIVDLPKNISALKNGSGLIFYKRDGISLPIEKNSDKIK